MLVFFTRDKHRSNIIIWITTNTFHFVFVHQVLRPSKPWKISNFIMIVNLFHNLQPLILIFRNLRIPKFFISTNFYGVPAFNSFFGIIPHYSGALFVAHGLIRFLARCLLALRCFLAIFRLSFCILHQQRFFVLLLDMTLDNSTVCSLLFLAVAKITDFLLSNFLWN